VTRGSSLRFNIPDGVWNHAEGFALDANGNALPDRGGWHGIDDGAGLTFADNIVGTQTQVRSGPLSIGAGDYPSGGNPNDFGINIGFSNYLYTGGNLLVELRHTGNGFGSRSVDAINATGGAGFGYGSLFSAAWSGSYDALTGMQGNFAITQFSAIPTPGAAGLLGLAGFAAMRRRR